MAIKKQKPDKRIEAMERALKVIHTWAAFDLEGKYPNNKALLPENVVKLCDEALNAGAEQNV